MSTSPIIYLIRHGEKPPKEDDGDDAVGLSEMGVERSQGLVNVFGKSSPYNIGLIIAEHPKKSGHRDRPWKTIEPLAKSLEPDVQINKEIERDDDQGVADAIKAYSGPGNVLVCWEHGQLTKIAKAIGVEPAPEYPSKRFDLIWTVEPPYNQISGEESENIPGLDDKQGQISVGA